MIYNVLGDVKDLFNIDVDNISFKGIDLIPEGDFSYRILDDKERDEVIVNILKKIESDNKIVGMPERTDTWSKGWLESLEEFRKIGTPTSLIPRYMKPNQFMRLNRQFVYTNDPHFEWHAYQIFKLCLFAKYLKDFKYIYELGCGTGHNLLTLAQLFPEKILYGFDFVKSSSDLVNLIASKFNYNITGDLFDMLQPDMSKSLKPNSVVLTCGAIEQLASNTTPILEYLLSQPIELCVHLEPIYELYEETNLVDYLAMKFHIKRGYTVGYLPKLQELEKQGKIDILEIKRLSFGSLYMEGYTCIIWKPLKGQL